MFRFLVALYIISFWSTLTWKHVLWAALVAILTFPLKKLWDWWIERFWDAFKTSFKAGFKQTPAGQEFFKSFYAKRAEKDIALVKQHPELEPMLHCKICFGKGCEDCGGTGWA